MSCRTSVASMKGFGVGVHVLADAGEEVQIDNAQLALHIRPLWIENLTIMLQSLGFRRS